MIKGQKHSEETRKKMSLMKIGHSVSKETRDKIRTAVNLRYKTDSTLRQRISNSHKGKYVKPETREKMRIAIIGRVSPMKGRKHSEETKQLYREMRSGAKSHLWRGGKTEESKLIRNSAAFRDWRTHVFKRDDYRCQGCGKRGGDLQADHELPFAYYPDLRFEILNGRTLCVPCHQRTPTYGRKAAQFVTYLKG